MPVRRCVVLLRGVNVGRAKRLAMADLRALLADLGATDVRTYLQSGNAVVTADPEGLAGRVEEALADRLGLQVRVLVVDGEQVVRVVDRNPFPERAAENPKLVHVAFLEKPADPAVLEAFGRRHGDDEIVGREGVIYLSYADSSLESPVSAVFARLDGFVTTRNWRTVVAVRDLVVDGG